MPESKHFSGLAKYFTDFSKVTFETERDLPLFLLNQLYTMNDGLISGRQQDRKRRIAQELKRVQEDCMHQFFSIIYCSYRKGFTPLLTESKEIRAYVEAQLIDKNISIEKVKTTTDANWGCTIRVGQMMLCQALMRHAIGED